MLVIDDEPAVREIMQRFLTREGYRVETAASGEEGLRLARAAAPDVITLDVLMPGMDGWAVLAALKADPRLADVPVIMLTIVDDRNLGYALGAAEYLVKPLDRDRLVEVIRRHRPERPILVVDDEPEQRAPPPAHPRARGVRGGGGGATGVAALDRLRESTPAV